MGCQSPKRGSDAIWVPEWAKRDFRYDSIFRLDKKFLNWIDDGLEGQPVVRFVEKLVFVWDFRSFLRN